jgi:hypothetical protein
MRCISRGAGCMRPRPWGRPRSISPWGSTPSRAFPSSRSWWPWPASAPTCVRPCRWASMWPIPGRSPASSTRPSTRW